MTLQQNSVLHNRTIPSPKERAEWNVTIQRLSPADLAELIEMENSYSNDPMSDRQLVGLFCTGRYYGISARLECSGLMIGYLMCEVTADRQIVKRLILSKEHRHLGVAQDLLWCVSNGQKQRTVIEVPESHLETQCYLRAARYRAIEILKDRETPAGERLEDAYLFQSQ